MERDDIIEYAHHDHHSEEEGKKARKRIWFVFWVLLVVTTAEVLLGAFGVGWGIPWVVIKWSFVIMTLVKAFYIVMTFMHLGDEVKNFRRFILVPYGIFILYLIFILLYEGGAIFDQKGIEKKGGEKGQKEAMIEENDGRPGEAIAPYHRS